jgi:hypothetical protein
MRIHAVMHQFYGDPQVQYVELRMNTGGQNLVGGHTIQFYDAANTLKATFTFPSSVANSTTGDSVLIGTTQFNDVTPGGDADFPFAGNTVGHNGFTDTGHPVQGPGGKVYFAPGNDNCDANFTVSAGEVDSLAYGAAAADWGSAAAAFTGADNEILRMKAGELTDVLFPETNSGEYEFASASSSTFSVASGDLVTDLSSPRKNNRTVLGMTPPSVGGVAAQPDVASLPAASGGGGSAPRALIYGLVGAAAAIVAIGAGAWRWRRRRA